MADEEGFQGRAKKTSGVAKVLLEYEAGGPGKGGRTHNSSLIFIIANVAAELGDLILQRAFDTKSREACSQALDTRLMKMMT